MQTGFSLLQQLALFPRDNLLPSPATNLTRAITKEMRYGMGHGLQNRVLLHLGDGKERLHIAGTTQFWTPHSGRAFLPSASALLGFDKTDEWLDGPGERQVCTSITDKDPEHVEGRNKPKVTLWGKARPRFSSKRTRPVCQSRKRSDGGV